MTEPEVQSQETPMPAQQYVPPPTDPALQEKWNEFLQKCCEAGQLRFQLTRLEGQQRHLEKQLEVTERAVEKAAAQHDALKKQQLEEKAKADASQNN